MEAAEEQVLPGCLRASLVLILFTRLISTTPFDPLLYQMTTKGTRRRSKANKGGEIMHRSRCQFHACPSQSRTFTHNPSGAAGNKGRAEREVGWVQVWLLVTPGKKSRVDVDEQSRRYVSVPSSCQRRGQGPEGRRRKLPERNGTAQDWFSQVSDPDDENIQQQMRKDVMSKGSWWPAANRWSRLGSVR